MWPARTTIMEGAALSGLRAAGEILAAMKK